MRRLDDGTVLLTRLEAAERVGKDERSLQRWVAAGELVPKLTVRLGRRRVIYFAEHEVLAVDGEMGARVGGRPRKTLSDELVDVRRDGGCDCGNESSRSCAFDCISREAS